MINLEKIKSEVSVYDLYILLLTSVYEGSFLAVVFVGRLIGFVIGLQKSGSFLMNLALPISSCRCFICLLNPSSSVQFVDELDRDDDFPLFLMFSAFSCSIVVSRWVDVVDIFVMPEFLSMLVLLCLRFNMSEYKVFPVFSCGKSCSSRTLI